MEEIKQWLSSNTPDYNTGVLLFAKHSRNKSLLHYFTRKGDTAILKLRYELGKIAGTGEKSFAPVVRRPLSPLPTPSQSSPIKSVERTVIDAEGKINPNDLPEYLRILYEKNVEDYKLLRGAHAAMAVAKTKAERKKLRKEIAKLDDAITKHWALIDEWIASGTGKKSFAPAATGSLTPQDVNAYRTYISRGLAEPDKLTDDKRATMQERITALLADGQKFDEETLPKLTALGFSLE
jgi:hypothetical protein